MCTVQQEHTYFTLFLEFFYFLPDNDECIEVLSCFIFFSMMEPGAKWFVPDSFKQRIHMAIVYRDLSEEKEIIISPSSSERVYFFEGHTHAYIFIGYVRV